MHHSRYSTCLQSHSLMLQQVCRCICALMRTAAYIWFTCSKKLHCRFYVARHVHDGSVLLLMCMLRWPDDRMSSKHPRIAHCISRPRRATPDQTRPDQTRQDKTRPEQSRADQTTRLGARRASIAGSCPWHPRAGPRAPATASPSPAVSSRPPRTGPQCRPGGRGRQR